MDTKIKSKYLQVMISCEIRQQGLNILQALIEKQLAFGGPIFSGPAKFLWKSEIVEHDYCYIFTFTREDLRDDLIRFVPANEIPNRTKDSFGDLTEAVTQDSTR